MASIKSERIDEGEPTNSILCGVQVDPDGSFALTGNLGPAEQIDVAMEIQLAESGLRFKGIDAAQQKASSVSGNPVGRIERPPAQPRLGSLGIVGLIGAACILASGPWSAVALIFLFARGEQRGDTSFAVALCRFVGAIVAVLGIGAAIAFLIVIIAEA